MTGVLRFANLTAKLTVEEEDTYNTKYETIQCSTDHRANTFLPPHTQRLGLI